MESSLYGLPVDFPHTYKGVATTWKVGLITAEARGIFEARMAQHARHRAKQQLDDGLLKRSEYVDKLQDIDRAEDDGDYSLLKNDASNPGRSVLASDKAQRFLFEVLTPDMPDEVRQDIFKTRAEDSMLVLMRVFTISMPRMVKKSREMLKAAGKADPLELLDKLLKEEEKPLLIVGTTDT